MSKIALIVMVSAALGACTTQTTAPATTASLDAMASATPPAAPQRLALMPGERALARLPASAGAIVAIRGDRFADGFHQTIEFGQTVAGLKPNRIDLRLRTRGTGQVLEGLAVAPPTQAMIRDELTSQFPKMDMRIVDQPRRNAAGIYGLAVGRWDNGARCIYAWQWIDAPATVEVSSQYDAATLRISMCGSGVSLDGLAGLIDDLQLSPAQTESASPAPAAALPLIKPRRTRAARPIEQSRHPTTVVVRHRAWDAVALNRPPVEPVVETSRALLDPTLPAAAFRGPTAATAANDSQNRR